jgi:hypothetical protein
MRERASAPSILSKEIPMSAAERERLRKMNSGETHYVAGAVLKCAVCLAVIGLLVAIGVSVGDPGSQADGATAVASLPVVP